MLRYCILFSLTVSIILSCSRVADISTDVLIVGGSVSGTAAAIQAARDGVDVILVEPTPWLGGMLTAAGVSATDGNHQLPSGLWGEFRQHLYDHYGGPEAVSTGWVSNTLFEPHVGNEIWNTLADEQASLKRYHGYKLLKIMKEDNSIKGAIFQNQGGDRLRVNAKITVEATELGDIFEMADAIYYTGVDTPENPHDTNVQDITYAAILKDYGKGADMTIEKPANYQPELYHCICETVCDADTIVMDCDQVLDYAELPNGKYMINWPHNGNDYYVDATKLVERERVKAYQRAKEITLGLVYFLQTEAGYPHLGLADDEFPTDDKLPFIPYHREARRIQGLTQLKVEDLIDPYADASRPLYRQAIAVGDYPLDHHHQRNPHAPEETYPPIPSFSIPYNCLVPEGLDGLIVAEKSISVTHMVNGASRLQPVVILIGQAAGAAAAMCVSQGVEPAALSVKALQQHLLDAHCWLMPFLDITPDDSLFQSVQRVGVAGWIRGHGVPYQWANQTWFYPDSCATTEVLLEAVGRASLSSNLVKPSFLNAKTTNSCIQVGEGIRLLYQLWQGQSLGQRSIKEEVPLSAFMNDALAFFEDKGWLKKLKNNEDELDLDRPLSRKELAWLLDAIYQPFEDVNSNIPGS